MMKLLALAMLLIGAHPGPHTTVNDSGALRRLQTNSGMTLQWIGFETPQRGHVRVEVQDGLVTLAGSQRDPGSSGVVTISGYIESIDMQTFTFVGRIVIIDAPDVGRECVRQGRLNFKATGKRRYWRLQDMEACDGLTDYVDIYF